MDNKWIKFLLVFGLMALAFVFLAISSSGNKTKQSTTKKVKKEKVANINDQHLSDKESLYTRKRPDVITMYLTVRRGNTAENTNILGENLINMQLMIMKKWGSSVIRSQGFYK